MPCFWLCFDQIHSPTHTHTHQVESCFLPTNPNVDFTPLAHTWGPLRPPSPATTFVDGLKTLCGHGDPTLKEGLAVHQYAFNTHMTRQALVNNDGSFLLLPQRRTLDLQTELGYLRVPPGSLAVIPPGIRFAVSIASLCPDKHDDNVNDHNDDNDARGYVLELFGAHFQLPDLGPLGANALAHVRDFQYPVASFDVDFASSSSSSSPTFTDPFQSSTIPPPTTDWRIFTKQAGALHTYTQPHTPFDVVAWHGRYAPYRYNLAHFGHLTANADQLDPTAYTVLTAPSRWGSAGGGGTSLVDVCVFGEKWAVARDTLRIPYHHRTVATEVVGVLRGRYGGSVRALVEGGMSFEQGFMAHGETGECWARESERRLEVEAVGKGFLGEFFVYWVV